MICMKTAMCKRTATTVGLMTLLWLLSALMIPSPSHAAIFFDSDFELGAGDDWAENDWNDFGTANAGHLEITNSLAFSGSKSVKGTFDRTCCGGNTQQPSIYRSWDQDRAGGRSHVFVRFAARHSPGFKRCDNGSVKMVRIQGEAGYPKLWINNLHGTYQVLMEAPYDRPSGAYVLSSGVAPSSGWDQLELEYKLNTPGQSNGLIRLWVNGNLKIEHLNHAYIGPTPTSTCGNGYSFCPSTVLLRTAQIYIQCGLGTIHYDRFAVGDTRIGLAGSKSMSADSTPPASPTGFQAH